MRTDYRIWAIICLKCVNEQSVSMTEGRVTTGSLECEEMDFAPLGHIGRYGSSRKPFKESLEGQNTQTETAPEEP